MERNESQAWLDSRAQFGIKLGLETMSRVLERLGRPERATVGAHIAGTNGKGSTGAFLESILRRAGFRTGFYSSPHLVRVNERVRVGGLPIDDQSLARALTRVREAAEGLPAPITYFEAMTAVAFLVFAQEKIDFAVVETGLGGRLDATNVLLPSVTIVTNVALDHREYLGASHSAIAR
ncbi:MAG: bifunctional folylpolyglutamate synthase/dihydrofolate synthase, partial [Vicinamibacteria bacterium]